MQPGSRKAGVFWHTQVSGKSISMCCYAGKLLQQPAMKNPTLVVVTAKEIKITQQIHFAFGKSDIRSISFPVLDAVADVLKSNPKIKLEVQGHTDNVGNKFFNKKLSQQRADSVRRYLTRKGISGSRLVAKGYGMEKPLVPNSNARNRALNRRVQFVRTEND